MRLTGKKAFTLVEMLIVVVIIGLLAGVLIGRYQSFLQSARDTARQASLKQLATNLEKYRIDWGDQYPPFSGCVENTSSAGIYGALVASGRYMDKLPMDPNNNRAVFTKPAGSAVTPENMCKGMFYYSSLKVSYTDNYGYLIVANSETPKGMNYVTGRNGVLADAGLSLAYDPRGDGEALNFYADAMCNTVVFSGSSSQCGVGITQGGISKGQENQNGWYVTFGGG